MMSEYEEAARDRKDEGLEVFQRSIASSSDIVR